MKKKTLCLIFICAVVLVAGIAGVALIHRESNEPPADDDALIATLIDYLRYCNAERLPMNYSAEKKIDMIKDGTQALHIGFDSSNSYFMCGYYNSAHNHEKDQYCCAKEYAWVKYERANEIQEYYNDTQIIAAFQINKALFTRDIMSKWTKLPRVA